MMNEDLDGDGQITAEDRKILGYGQEAFRMSLNSNFSWNSLPTLYFEAEVLHCAHKQPTLLETPALGDLVGFLKNKKKR